MLRARLRLALVSLLSVLCLCRGAAAVTLPADFSDGLVATVPSPTAMAFTPDGRLLITTQPGALRVYAGGSLLTNPALNLAGRLCANSERGLLGIAVDPAFAATRWIYVFYTFNKLAGCPTNSPSAPVNRVSRFTLPDSNVVDPASEVVLLDNLPSPGGNHNGGDLHFGADGLLYISVGDGGCKVGDGSRCAGQNDNARSLALPLGKILRVQKDGAIPADNPHAAAAGARRCGDPAGVPPGAGPCKEIFATGLRNPFRFAFRPGTSDFYINDVGQNAWEEIDRGARGADFGWNVREGHCANGSTTNCGPPPAGMTNPIFDYGRGGGCASITGGAFVPAGAWPAPYDGAYLFADYVCGQVFRLDPAGAGFTAAPFVTGLGGSSAVSMRFGPDGARQSLYYTTYAGGGQVRRIAYTGSTNRPPVAVLRATPTSGPAPLSVSFDGSGSSDPDAGDALTYSWSFGDGTPGGTGATVTHSYATPGTYTATLTVRDRAGAAASATGRIDAGNSPPTPVIDAPQAALRFRVGQAITLQGRATDPQDGALPDSALSWQVLLHHNDDHTHPYFSGTGNNLTFNAPPPEDLPAAAGSYLEVRLTATDSRGLSQTVTQDLQPARVNVTFATQPAGLRVTVNGATLTGPQTVVSWEGYALNVSAAAQSSGAGQPYEFAAWSDGGAAAHTITTPAQAATYTATFTPGGAGGGLIAEYFDNADLTGSRLRRIDGTVDFNWGTGSPAPGVGADTFSARWIGQIEPRYSETYTFTTTSDDGVRLWIDGRPLINNWTDHAPRDDRGTIALQAGRRYAITMEYYERGGGAVAQLRWSSPSQVTEVVPRGRLHPRVAINFQPAGAAVPPGYLADVGEAFLDRGNGLAYGWNTNNRGQTRDRNSGLSPGQEYDTLTHLQKPENPGASWEIALPPGSYEVRVVSGDAANWDSVYRVAVEGVLTVTGTPGSSTRWIEGEATVTVGDGRLSVTSAAGASNNKLCFLEIEAR